MAFIRWIQFAKIKSFFDASNYIKDNKGESLNEIFK